MMLLLLFCFSVKGASVLDVLSPERGLLQSMYTQNAESELNRELNNALEEMEEILQGRARVDPGEALTAEVVKIDLPVGHFVQDGTLGAGAFGEVLHLKYTYKNRKFVLKRFKRVHSDGDKTWNAYDENNSSLERFREEIQHSLLFHQAQPDAVPLTHPALLQFRDDDHVYSLSEFGGIPLIDWFGKFEFTEEQLLRIIGKYKADLAAFRRNKLYHGDIKPNNLLLDHTMSVHWIDFDNAIKWENVSSMQGRKILQRGNPLYLSTEAVHFCEWEQSDSFALKTTLLLLCTGKTEENVWEEFMEKIKGNERNFKTNPGRTYQEFLQQACKERVERDRMETIYSAIMSY